MLGRLLTASRDRNHIHPKCPLSIWHKPVGGYIVGRTRLSPELYSTLQNVATPIFKAKDTILFQAGQAADGAFLVRSGRVRMSLDQSPLYPTRSMGPGHVIGLPATFSGEPYSLTAKAERNCHLDFIPRDKLLDLLRCNPEVGFQVVRILSEEIFQMRKAAQEVPLRSTRTFRKTVSHRQPTALTTTEVTTSPHIARRRLGSQRKAFR